MQNNEYGSRPGQGQLSPGDDKLWATCAHLGVVALFIIPFLGSVLAPLGIWLYVRDRSAFAARHARTALNFQISCLVYSAAALLLAFAGIGFLLLLAIGVLNLVASIIAVIRANEGSHYDYPLSLTIIR